MPAPADTPLRRIVICGGGLAAWMLAAHLSRRLPDSTSLAVVGPEAHPVEDALYGQVLPPEFYGFHLGLGIEEPALLLRTGTAFAFGLSVEQWGRASRSWIQPFHQPLAAIEGVPLATVIAQQPDTSLQPFLVSVEAIRHGRFAHPPEDSAHPLSRAEYGYLFDPVELTALYKNLCPGVEHITGEFDDLESDGPRGTRLRLQSGQTIEADLFIDCSGPTARFARTTPEAKKPFYARLHRQSVRGPDRPVRRLVANTTGWATDVITRTGRIGLEVSGERLEGGSAFYPRFQDEPWSGNVVAVGQAACTLEPLTLAPMRMLLADIRRLAGLIPVSRDCTIEAREYNLAARNDRTNALIFHHAHFADIDLPEGTYWQDNAAFAPPELERKLTQFTERGYLVGYDHELFDPLDWAVLHDGLGRKPRRPDALARALDPAKVSAQLDALRGGVQAVVAKMPPHAIYMGKFLDYLSRRTG